MARILVIADHQDGDLKKSTLQTLTLAREIASRTGGGFSIAVIGSGVGAVANQLTSYGAERVLVVDAPAYAHYLAENTSKAVAALAKQTGASFVLSSTGTTGKDMLPRVAAQLGQGMVADCVGLAGEGATLLYKRPMYAGNIIATVRVNSARPSAPAARSSTRAGCPTTGRSARPARSSRPSSTSPSASAGPSSTSPA
jgi:electron transfer flavoprotein alpha subunit